MEPFQSKGQQAQGKGQPASFIPDFLAPLLAKQYPPECVDSIFEGYFQRRAVSLRANALASDREAVSAVLDGAGILWRHVKWYEDAFVLPEACERDVWKLDAYRQGELYLQNLSSMIPPLVLDARAGEDVCDMCAAPGGKTTQIAALTGGKAYITACEMHAPRAEKLEHNLRKLKASNVTVMRTDARRLDDFFSFDRVLVDAPCSGSGTLNASDTRIAKRFTEALLAKSVKAQKALIGKALALVKPGGTLVYSTCSILAHENEEIVEWALAHQPRGSRFELVPAVIENGDTLPCLPTRYDEMLCLHPTSLYEGFFVAKLRRTR